MDRIKRQENHSTRADLRIRDYRDYNEGSLCICEVKVLLRCSVNTSTFYQKNRRTYKHPSFFLKFLPPQLQATHNARRQLLVHKLQMGVSVNKVLKEVRKKTDSDFANIAFITKKDVENLVSKFSIGQDFKLDTDEAKSVEEFVIKDKGKTVKMYKPVGVHDTRYPKLGVGDFALVLMNDQKLESLGTALSSPQSILGVDSTYGTNEYSILLTTLMTVNSFGNGVSCAFFLTTKESGVAMQYFLESIKSVVGNLQPKVS